MTVLQSLPLRTGHFRYESGHHGAVWLDLELLCLHPEPIRVLAGRLASALPSYHVETVCGPLVEGAFVALMVASALDVPFTYAERIAATLAVLGDAADRLAASAGVPLEALERVPNELWTPADCPRCARGMPLTDPMTMTDGEEP